MVSDDELEHLQSLWKQTSPGAWEAFKHGSRDDWFTEGPDITVPFMPEGDAKFICEAHRLVPRLIKELKEARKR